MTQLDSKANLYRAATKALWIGLVCNAALGVIKLASGLGVGSFAMLSDAVNSLGDVGISGILLAALWLAQRPADDEHPYGHTRAEAIAGLSVAVMVFLMAFLVGWETLKSWEQPTPVPPLWLLWIAAVNVGIKEVLYWYTNLVGKRTKSIALVASAWDHRSDAFCSLAVLVGLVFVRFGGEDFLLADKIAALIVVVAISVSAMKLFFGSSWEMMDAQAEESFVGSVRQTAETVRGVRAIEKLFVRKSGIEYLVDIHVEVDGDINVTAGHRIGHDVKKELLAQYPSVRDVLVHLEPHCEPEVV